MQLTLVSSPGVGRDFNGNELRIVTDFSRRYCPLWIVLHDHCFYNLASHKNTIPRRFSNVAALQDSKSPWLSLTMRRQAG